MKICFPLTLFVLVGAPACVAPGAYTVRARAAEDLGCVSDDVVVQRIDARGTEDRWAARGCGRKADYACHGDAVFGPYVCGPLAATR